MTSCYGNGSQTGAQHWREVMGEQDREHGVAQGLPDIPALTPVTSALLVDTGPATRPPSVSIQRGTEQIGATSVLLPYHQLSRDQSGTQPSVPDLSGQPDSRVLADQPELASPEPGSASLSPSGQRSKVSSLSARFTPGCLQEPSKTDPHSGDRCSSRAFLHQPLRAECQGDHHACASPSEGKPRPVTFLPPPPAPHYRPESRSVCLTSSLALRSPKRTISFDFAHNMDPRRVEEIHRQIVHMAHQAGLSHSLKIVEEPQEEEEEPLPVLQLQDPPKPKCKRQLSADTSPPDKLSTAGCQANAGGSQTSAGGSQTSAGGSQHLQSQQTLPVMGRPSPGLSILQAQGEGSSYSSSAVSPKRLKSDHGSVAMPRTPPQSPLVKQATVQAGETSTVSNGVQLPTCKQTDVVHIFPKLGKGMSDVSSIPGDRTRVEDSRGPHTENRQVDETDTRSEQQDSDVVSVLKGQQPKKADRQERQKPGELHSKTACEPQDTMQTLSMLFRRKGETLELSSAKEVPCVEQQTVMSDSEGEPVMKKDVIRSSVESQPQKGVKTDISGVQKPGEQCVWSKIPQSTMTSSTQSAGSPLGNSSAPYKMTTPQRMDDTLSDTESYMAELAGRLQKMQRMISQTALQENDMETEMLTPDQDTEEDTAVSSFTNRELMTDEESRTARLYRSKTNPFTVCPGDIEKAKTILSGCQPVNLASAASCGQTVKEGVLQPPENRAVEEQTQRPFRLGDLWISNFKDGQSNALMKHRQMSDPGSIQPLEFASNPPLENRKQSTLRQFSEPGRPQDQTNKSEYGEFHKNPKQPGKSLKQQLRLRSESSEGLNMAERHPAFFLDEEEKEARELGWRNYPTSPSPLVRGPRHSRTQQSSDNSSARERAFNREYGDRLYQSNQPTALYPLSCGDDHGSLSPSDWIHSARQHSQYADRSPASWRPAPEDDNVFEDVSRPARGSPFLRPWSTAGFADRCPDRTDYRTPAMALSADSSPRRPALRSQSNVEQSPNKAELDAMSQYKYLRSFSEHISDPKRLMEQLRVRPPADCDQLVEQLQGMRRMAVSGPSSSSSCFTRDKDLERCIDRHGTVRRALFQDADERKVGGYELAEWQQQGCYTYPPPLTRRQSFSSARDLRRSQSWIRDMDSGDRHGVTVPRQPGDLDVTLECTQATPSSSHPHQHGYLASPTTSPQHPEILRMKIETYIQQILKNHLQIRPSSTSQADMDLWIAQAADIERLTQEASQLIGSLSQHNRSVYDVLNGSVVIRLHCCSLLGAVDLWERYESGALQRLVMELFGGDRLLAVTGCVALTFRVSVCRLQYTACLEELGERLAAHTPALCHSLPRCDSCSTGCREVCQLSVFTPSCLPSFILLRSRSP